MDASETKPSGQHRSDPAALAAVLATGLLKASATIATAESLTGGALGAVLSAAPGSSDTYLGGVVTYVTRLKVSVLGVSQETMERHGVVSAQCAAEMASGVRSLARSDYAVSTTGVAGPTEQEGKPVGVVFVGVAGPGGVSTTRLHLEGGRAEIRDATCVAAITAVMATVVDIT